jgi:dolichyl-phosphate-mannose-protein mannosyltransferase
VEIKKSLSEIYRGEYFWLYLLVMLTLILHVVIIGNPSALILDELHYVPDARSIMQNQETMHAEHPPLAKLFIVGGISLFGDNFWGWRFFSVVFGTVTIVLFYFLCRRLTMSRNAASIATFLLALENMTFVQASVAMLDVYCLTFMMASFLLYASRKYASSGVAVGLSALAKLNGALALPVIFIHWLFHRPGRSWWFVLTIVLAPAAFVGLMFVFDLAIVRDFSALVDPITRIKTMLSLSGSLTFAAADHPAMSRPWDWLIYYRPMGYWYYPHYLAAISPSIWALIMPTFAYMVYRAVKGSQVALFGAAWFAGTYLVWIPLSLITNRVSYIYYFYPTIGAICLGLGLGLSQLLDFYQKRIPGKLKKTVLALFVFYLVFHLACFVCLSPVFPIYWPFGGFAPP